MPYDLFGDWDLIVSSFAEQYGIRIYSDEFRSMNWNEFTSLLGGIAPETALGRIVSIRTETDKEVIKEWPPELKQIRTEWITKQAKAKEGKEETKQQIEWIQNALLSIAKTEEKGD